MSSRRQNRLGKVHCYATDARPERGAADASKRFAPSKVSTVELQAATDKWNHEYRTNARTADSNPIRQCSFDGRHTFASATPTNSMVNGIDGLVVDSFH